jgi:hypothetical protein
MSAGARSLLRLAAPMAPILLRSSHRLHWASRGEIRKRSGRPQAEFGRVAPPASLPRRRFTPEVLPAFRWASAADDDFRVAVAGDELDGNIDAPRLGARHDSCHVITPVRRPPRLLYGELHEQHLLHHRGGSRRNGYPRILRAPLGLGTSRRPKSSEGGEVRAEDWLSPEKRAIR